ncbi:MAG: MBL fold metallo-hydrolase [Eubacteriales bacterium]|nr:MBL fold metallo-hydrolase [Eubacteriales bacterium]
MLMIVVVGIILAILAVSVMAYVAPMRSMHPLASGKIAGTDVTAIKNRINNLFFLPSGDGWIVIDAGSDAEMGKREMDRLSIDGRKVKGVFLTHTDYDHVACVVLFPNAVIYMNQQEKQMIDGSTFRQFVRKNRLPKLRDTNEIVWMADQESVNFGERRVTMLSVPGHTTGSAMYAVDGKYLFTGDAFCLKDDHILVHPYTMDKLEAQKSIRKIKGELQKYEKVFTAHYGLME